MTACAVCGAVVENEAQSGVLCQSCFSSEQDAPKRSGLLSKIPIALFISFVPFCASYRTTQSSTSTVNGEVVASNVETMDYIALALGPVAIVLGLVAVKRALSGPAETKTRDLGLAAAAIVVGLYQIARGFGMA